MHSYFWIVTNVESVADVGALIQQWNMYSIDQRCLLCGGSFSQPDLSICFVHVLSIKTAYSVTPTRVRPTPAFSANWSDLCVPTKPRKSTRMSSTATFTTPKVAQNHSHLMESFSQPASKCYTYDPEMSVYRVQLVSSVIEIEVAAFAFYWYLVISIGAAIVRYIESIIVWEADNNLTEEDLRRILQVFDNNAIRERIKKIYLSSRLQIVFLTLRYELILQRLLSFSWYVPVRFQITGTIRSFP